MYWARRLLSPILRPRASAAHRRARGMSSAISCAIHCSMRLGGPSAMAARRKELALLTFWTEESRMEKE